MAFNSYNLNTISSLNENMNRRRGPPINPPHYSSPPGLSDYNLSSNKHSVPNQVDHITNGILSILDDNPKEDKKKELIEKIINLDENKTNLILKLLDIDIVKLSIILGLIQDDKLINSITKISHILNKIESKQQLDDNDILDENKNIKDISSSKTFKYNNYKGKGPYKKKEFNSKR